MESQIQQIYYNNLTAGNLYYRPPANAAWKVLGVSVYHESDLTVTGIRFVIVRIEAENGGNQTMSVLCLTGNNVTAASSGYAASYSNGGAGLPFRIPQHTDVAAPDMYDDAYFSAFSGSESVPIYFRPGDPVVLPGWRIAVIPTLQGSDYYDFTLYYVQVPLDEYLRSL